MPEQAPAARPMAGYTVMSWHWFVSLVVCVPGPWSPFFARPAITPVAGSAKILGWLTTRAFSGDASGIWITSML